MFIPLHPHQRDQKQFHFGERRMANFLGLGLASSALKGVMSEVKGAPDKVREGAGAVGKFFNWMTTADTAPGYILKSPFILTRKAVEATVGTYQTVNDAALILGTKVGSIIKKPLNDSVLLAKEMGEQTVKAAIGTTVLPMGEILKSNLIEFPTRAIVDQFRTGLKTIFGTVGAVATNTVEAVKQTALSPFTIATACRDAVKEVLWDAPKSLLSLNFKEAGHHLMHAPFGVAEGVLRAPLAIGAIPYHAGMQLALGGVETAFNASRAMAAPVEGMVNAYRGIGQTAGSFLDYLKTKLSIDMGASYRDRFHSIFSTHSPLAA